MVYRELGRTGLKVSELGLGCEGFIGKDEAFTREMFDLAFSSGMNCMDMYTPDPDVHRRVGAAIHDKRKDFILQYHLCSQWRNGQYERTRQLDKVKIAWETALRELDTDYIDIGMLHYVDSDESWDLVQNNGIVEYAQELKKQGVIRHIGLSSHNTVAAQRIVESGLVDVIMFSVNPCYDLLPGDTDMGEIVYGASYKDQIFSLDPDRARLYETCQRLGVAITVMKPFGGGQLLPADSPAGAALTVDQCLHYALTRPGVSTVFVGAHSVQELARSIAYEDAPEEARDYAAAFAAFPKISWQGHCMYCGHCAPCPKGIEVANVTKFLNLCKAQGTVPETVREHYKVLKAHAGDCIQCGACETRCPFQVSIMQNMAEAKKVFGY